MYDTNGIDYYYMLHLFSGACSPPTNEVIMVVPQIKLKIVIYLCYDLTRKKTKNPTAHSIYVNFFFENCFLTSC